VEKGKMMYEKVRYWPFGLVKKAAVSDCFESIPYTELMGLSRRKARQISPSSRNTSARMNVQMDISGMPQASCTWEASTQYVGMANACGVN
jgi:hypothetical protein